MVFKIRVHHTFLFLVRQHIPGELDVNKTPVNPTDYWFHRKVIQGKEYVY
jgi:hypothetical protein